jgi:hypothetical protein
MVDFDEIERFPTDLHVADSDGDLIGDKTDVSAYVFGPGIQCLGTCFPHCSPADFDGDGCRQEIDPDNDEDGCKDGDEDTNHDGRWQAGEKSTFHYEDCVLMQSNCPGVRIENCTDPTP